jgi:hypothetical protein
MRFIVKSSSHTEFLKTRSVVDLVNTLNHGTVFVQRGNTHLRILRAEIDLSMDALEISGFISKMDGNYTRVTFTFVSGIEGRKKSLRKS